MLSLNTHLTEKADVEKQRDLWKAQHDTMEIAKRDLQTQLEGTRLAIIFCVAGIKLEYFYLLIKGNCLTRSNIS